MSVLIGCPAETEPRENRVALTPDVAARLHRARLDVIVESGAGRGAWFQDEEYVAAGARIGSGEEVYVSLGGGANSSVDDAVRRMITDGVATAIAAGNGNVAGKAQDACKSSPARVSQAMTIGATDRTDKKASWSNYGNCVDWFAPGVGITSAWITSTTATNTISGTSMATPHTAGVAALYLQSSPGATPQQVREALFAGTTKSIVTNSRTANNHLLFTNY